MTHFAALRTLLAESVTIDDSHACLQVITHFAASTPCLRNASLLTIPKTMEDNL